MAEPRKPRPFAGVLEQLRDELDLRCDVNEENDEPLSMPTEEVHRYVRVKDDGDEEGEERIYRATLFRVR